MGMAKAARTAQGYPETSVLLGTRFSAFWWSAWRLAIQLTMSIRFGKSPCVAYDSIHARASCSCTICCEDVSSSVPGHGWSDTTDSFHTSCGFYTTQASESTTATAAVTHTGAQSSDRSRAENLAIMATTQARTFTAHVLRARFPIPHNLANHVIPILLSSLR